MSEPTIHSETFVMFGLNTDIVLVGVDDERAGRIIEMLKDELARLELEISRSNPSSFVLKTDHSPKGKWIKCSPDFFDVLLLCSDFYEMSNGAYDITMGPLTEWWSITDATSPKELQARMQQCGFDKVELDPEHLRFRFMEEGMQFDFSTIELAYALDLLKLLLRDEAVENAIVNFEERAVLALGHHPAGEAWPIGIRNMQDTHEFLQFFEMKDTACITDGTYFLSEEAAGLQPRVVVSPENGEPVEGIKTVSVKTGAATMGAFLARVWLILPENDKSILAEQLQDIEIFEAEYLDDDIRTKLTILNREEEDE
ncbi:FAD:protein FMN transferase [Maribellus sp. YY47]|uniref:FAD:protein FMN transferase n=1 Tax=Maribellus sp. YY47 TaxID=2929486 RepID=UPI0020015D1D|nr:FAD:protein FMN transferase [Maribellus sp. YY47]MCK3685267.1 FAD:protein FMN transferase [Maribellus sp. YY47]